MAQKFPQNKLLNLTQAMEQIQVQQMQPSLISQPQSQQTQQRNLTSSQLLQPVENIANGLDEFLKFLDFATSSTPFTNSFEANNNNGPEDPKMDPTNNFENMDPHQPCNKHKPFVRLHF